MKSGQHGRRYDAKETPEHFARLPLPKIEIVDEPIPDDQRNIIPFICRCSSLSWFVISTVPQREYACASSL